LKEEEDKIQFRVSKSFKKQILDYIGYDPEIHKWESDAFREYFKKVIFNKDSLVTSNQQVKSDVETSNPSLKERMEKNPAKEEFIKRINEPLPPPPCPYVAKDTYIDPKTGLQYVFCDNPKRRGKCGKPTAIPLTVCQKCWERREWVRERKKKIPKQIKEIYCPRAGTWILPSACITCKHPCEKAPPENPYLSDIERQHRLNSQE